MPKKPLQALKVHTGWLRRSVATFCWHEFIHVQKLGSLCQKPRYWLVKWLTSLPGGLHCRRCKSLHYSHRRRTLIQIQMSLSNDRCTCDFSHQNGQNINISSLSFGWSNNIAGDILASLHFRVDDGWPFRKAAAVVRQVQFVVHILACLVHRNFNVQQFWGARMRSLEQKWSCFTCIGPLQYSAVQISL